MQKKNNYLYCFLKGISSLQNLFPETLKHPMSGKSDNQWLKSDWKEINKNLQQGMGQLINGRKTRTK